MSYCFIFIGPSKEKTCRRNQSEQQKEVLAERPEDPPQPPPPPALVVDHQQLKVKQTNKKDNKEIDHIPKIHKKYLITLIRVPTVP